MSAALRPGVRLLVRVPDWLGDLVMAEPALRALHERVRALDGTLTLAGDVRLLEVFGDAFSGARRAEASDARAWSGHDVALLFTNSFRSAWCAFRARIPRRFGYARDCRSGLLTDAFVPAREVGGVPLGLGVRGRGRRWLPRPFGATCIELVHWLGVPVRDTRPRLTASSSGRAKVRERFAASAALPERGFVLANVGARPGSAKGYPTELWARALAEVERPLVLVGGPGEEAAVRAVLAALGGERARACLDPVADLGELVALCSQAERVVTADCGTRHVANAVGARSVVVFGPTDPRHTADHTERTTLVRSPVECGPCHRELCPLEGDARLGCMRLVEPSRISRHP